MSEHDNSSNDFDMDLSQYDAAYGQAKIKEGGDSPDGKYQVKVERCEMRKGKDKAATATEAARPGSPMIYYMLRIHGSKDGKYLGGVIHKNSVLGPNTMDHIKTELAMLGFHYQPSEWKAHLSELLDKYIVVTQKTKTGTDGKENRNVYFNKLITAEQVTPSSGGGAVSAAGVAGEFGF